MRRANFLEIIFPATSPPHQNSHETGIDIGKLQTKSGCMNPAQAIPSASRSVKKANSSGLKNLAPEFERGELMFPA